jgi:hypothetical protein
MNQGGRPSRIIMRYSLGQRQWSGLEPASHSHQLASAQRLTQSRPSSQSNFADSFPRISCTWMEPAVCNFLCSARNQRRKSLSTLLRHHLRAKFWIGTSISLRCRCGRAGKMRSSHSCIGIAASSAIVAPCHPETLVLSFYYHLVFISECLCCIIGRDTQDWCRYP